MCVTTMLLGGGGGDSPHNSTLVAPVRLLCAPPPYTTSSSVPYSKAVPWHPYRTQTALAAVRICAHQPLLISLAERCSPETSRDLARSPCDLPRSPCALPRSPGSTGRPPSGSVPTWAVLRRVPKAQYKCCSVPTPVTTLTLPRRSAVARGSGPIGSCHGLLPLGSHRLLVGVRG